MNFLRKEVSILNTHTHIGKLVPLSPVGPTTPNRKGVANQDPDWVGITLVVRPNFRGFNIFGARRRVTNYEWQVSQNPNTILRVNRPHHLP